MLDSMDKVKAQYEPRIRAMLERWRQACLARAWPTSEVTTDFERLPSGHPVHRWSFNADVAPERRARVSVTLETETDPTDDQGLVTVLHCFSSVSFGMMGSDFIAWDAPKVSEYLGDDAAIEEQFQLLGQAEGVRLAQAINQRTVN